MATLPREGDRTTVHGVDVSHGVKVVMFRGWTVDYAEVVAALVEWLVPQLARLEVGRAALDAAACSSVIRVAYDYITPHRPVVGAIAAHAGYEAAMYVPKYICYVFEPFLNLNSPETYRSLSLNTRMLVLNILTA